MNLESPLSGLKGVGPAVAAKLAVLGLFSEGDLIEYFPRRYDDYSQLTPLNKLLPGPVSVRARILQASGRYGQRGIHVTEAVASDGSGSVRLVWFNQPYRAAAIKAGQEYFIAGNYELSRQRFAIMNPSIELASDFPLNTARIVPVYRETKGLTSRQLRGLLAQVVPLIKTLPETLPAWLIKEQKLLVRPRAYMGLHFPDSSEHLAAARHRLGFEEVFRLTLASLLNKQENAAETALTIPFNADLARQFVAELPFKLTDAQRKTVWQAYQDMERVEPMNRLVEGDVGSGKTVVAAMAALMALEQGYQVAFMAPTELLARQHAETLHKLLQPLGHADGVTLLVGSLTSAQKKKAHEAISGGSSGLIVGTQALIQEKVDMHKLALVIIDEQHRFGVDQRKALMAKAGHMPHVLSLTATPIPRSLALTLYGELDLSVVKDKPAGRQPVATELVHPNERADIYARIAKQLAAGRQAFVVCPLISESDLTPGVSAETVYESLRKDPHFKNYRLGLLHGRQKAAEKNEIMERFVAGKLDLIVSTTVIEVGVDVPNATVMMIESPERFGLAQIHQLRGRVGRGEHQAHCFLMLSDAGTPSPRLRALESSQDGFKLAELDLRLRGPGAMYGTLQHGALDLRIARLDDAELIAAARQAAIEFIDRREDLLQYEGLAAHVARLRTVTNLN